MPSRGKYNRDATCSLFRFPLNVTSQYVLCQTATSTRLLRTRTYLHTKKLVAWAIFTRNLFVPQSMWTELVIMNEAKTFSFREKQVAWQVRNQPKSIGL